MTSAQTTAAVASPHRSLGVDVTEVVGCRTTADAVGRFLREEAPVLIVDALAVALPHVGPLGCTLTRSKLKPHRRLTVSADVHGPGLPARPVSVVWGAPPTAWSGDAPDPVVPERLRAPFTALRARSGSGPAEMSVLVSPLDPTFPALAAAHDAEHLARVLRSRGVEAAAADLAVTPLRYRPGQRHVLRLQLGGSGPTIYAKCYRDDTGARAAQAWAPVQSALTQWGGPAAAARPVGYVEADRLMLWEGSSGTALTGLLERSPAHVGSAGAALRAIHDAPVAAPDRARRSDPQAEVEATLRSCEHVSALAPDRGALLGDILADVTRRLATTTAEAGHLLHGDYKCDNILVEDGGLRLLDLDRVTVGDPALDLGKMTSDLRWWALRDGIDAEPVVAAFLDGYGPCPQHRLRRAAGYDVVFTLRSVGRRVELHAPGWARRVEQVLTALTRRSADR